jgi:hypothetical protein
MTHRLNIEREPLDLVALEREAARMRAETLRDICISIGRGVSTLTRSVVNLLRSSRAA